jgi:peptide deformylase
MPDELKIIHYPDPRLKRTAATIEVFDEQLAALASKMFELMRASRGVGLAAPQIGKGIRLFVMNHTQQPDDARAYVNPELFDASDEEEAEEGCLSLPGINVNVARAKTVTLRAQDLQGNPVELTESGYVARIWQHEIDHLNGVLITDRVGPGTKLMLRKTLKELEDQYAAEHPAPRAAAPRAKARARR